MCKVTQIMPYKASDYDEEYQYLIVFRSGKIKVYKHNQKRYDRMIANFKKEVGKVSTYTSRHGFFVSSQELSRTIQLDMYRFKL